MTCHRAPLVRLNAPRKALPIGVRAAETMTASGMRGLRHAASGQQSWRTTSVRRGAAGNRSRTRRRCLCRPGAARRRPRSRCAPWLTSANKQTFEDLVVGDVARRDAGLPASSANSARPPDRGSARAFADGFSYMKKPRLVFCPSRPIATSRSSTSVRAPSRSRAARNRVQPTSTPERSLIANGPIGKPKSFMAASMCAGVTPSSANAVASCR